MMAKYLEQFDFNEEHQREDLTELLKKEEVYRKLPTIKIPISDNMTD